MAGRSVVRLDDLDPGIDEFVPATELDPDVNAVLRDQGTRLRILRMIAEEALAVDVSAMMIANAIVGDEMGPICRRNFDDLVHGLGLPRSKVIDIISHMICQGRDVWPAEVALLCVIYGPSVPNLLQSKEILRFASQLHRRAVRQDSVLTNAVEMVKSVG